MNRLSNLKFNIPTFTLIRVHPRPSALQASHCVSPRPAQFLAFSAFFAVIYPFRFRPFPALAVLFP